MEKIYVLPEDELRGEIYKRILLLLGRGRGSWQASAAAVGLCGGLLSIVLGCLVWAAVGLFAPVGVLGSSLDVAGTVLFTLPLPLLALGAYCLDLLETDAAALPHRVEPRRDARPKALRPRLSARSGRLMLDLVPLVPWASQKPSSDEQRARASSAGPSARRTPPRQDVN